MEVSVTPLRIVPDGQPILPMPVTAASDFAGRATKYPLESLVKTAERTKATIKRDGDDFLICGGQQPVGMVGTMQDQIVRWTHAAVLAEQGAGVICIQTGSARDLCRRNILQIML